MSPDTMDLEIVVTPGLGNATYLVASGRGGGRRGSAA